MDRCSRKRPHAFSFRWNHPEGTEPRERNSMLVEFTLTEEPGGTRLRVVESGMRELDWPEEERRRRSTITHAAGTATSAICATTSRGSSRPRLGEEVGSRR